jgi:hypothetical protein
VSDDELFVTIIACFLGPVQWVISLIRWRRLPRAGAALGTLAVTLAICTAILLSVLTTLAADDVVTSWEYIFMYAVLGLAWIRVAEWFFGLAGLSLRDDALERRNSAAAIAAAGALPGVTLCYAGANIGDGPGWWVVVFSAALATAGFFACWLLLGRFTVVNDAVAIDRDPAAGIRLGAWLLACGLVLGRAVAGDWESAAQTIHDAAIALPPLAVLTVIAVPVERVARPTAARPRAPVVLMGLLPAVVYLAIACAAVARLGWPE